jgi:hypothetical protein
MYFGQVHCLAINKNILQFSFILNNKAIVLESFIQIFGMVAMYFSKFLAISKRIKLVPNQARHYDSCQIHGVSKELEVKRSYSPKQCFF